MELRNGEKVVEAWRGIAILSRPLSDGSLVYNVAIPASETDGDKDVRIPVRNLDAAGTLTRALLHAT